ncbi:MAG: dihydroorotase [Bacteroidales bacterium]|nr:dihydroorotase [Bacteroidales bacterium]
MRTLIKNATIVNEGTEFCASVLIENDLIAKVFTDDVPKDIMADSSIDATGLLLMPGVIDDHVHMRDPGLTHKADMQSETRAAAAGGVTSVMDMPNVMPQTTTIELWQQKMQHAAETSRVNYAVYLGATNDNLDEIRKIDPTRIPALKLFMGSSTGGMLVDQEEPLCKIFSECPTLIMTHCEDTQRINTRMAEAKKQHGDDPSTEWHAWIRDDEACYMSSALAVSMARKTGARLHLAHITTAKELSLLSTEAIGSKNITAEVCPQHLYYTANDYKRLGSLIKCNPSIKSDADRQALRQALNNGLVDVIGTDHAPHLLSEKLGGAAKAVSGMPMMQFSLPLMLTMSDEGILPRTRLVELMCHNPALLFHIEKRGFIREGYKADLVLLKKQDWKVSEACILSKCGWSPLTGETLSWKVASTWCNGLQVYDGVTVNDNVRGEALRFC